MIIYKWTKQKTVAVPTYEQGVTTLATYQSKLTELGLLYSVSYQSTNAIASNNGTVASVTPASGSSAVVGSTVTIYVYSYTATPTPTPNPTVVPTTEPTAEPTVEPTAEPTQSPDS